MESRVNLVIGMPWRPGAGRLLAHDLVYAFYRNKFPEAEIIEVDTDHAEYNLAAARNLAVREAESAGADVVIITDADCLIAPSFHLDDAIAGALSDGKVHMPFTNQMYLSEQETVDIAVSRQFPELGGHLGNGCCYVTTPGTYWRFGGSDERFSGWGGDDDQLVAAATCLVGLVRHSGTSLSLWHPAFRDVGSERHRPNGVLASRYWNAINSPKAMRRIISERDSGVNS